ncbi:MAG: TolC family protein [Sandaracinus sp.]|nr:TolC family protein [Sandaracinus sp.]MCB9631037.1 TolC family protein [Sandaracinus sp.]
MRLSSLAALALFALFALFAFVAHARAQPATQELSLEDAVRLALAHDPRVIGAAAEHERRRADAAVIRGRLLPNVDFEQAFVRTDQAVAVFGTRLLQGRFRETDFALPALNDPNAITDHASTLRVEVPLVHVEGWLGARAARALSRGAHADVRLRELEVAASVIRLYHQVVLAETSASVAEEAATAARADAERIRSMYAHGAATELDVLEMDVHLATLDERVIAARGDAASVRAALHHAIGLPLDTPLRLVTELASIDDAPSVDAAQITLDDHPTVARARHTEEAARIARRASRARFAPVLAAAGELQSHRASLGADAAHGESYVLGVVLRLNLFRGLQDLASTRAADALSDAAHADAVWSESAVRTQIRRAQIAVESAHARLDVATQAVGLAQRALQTQRHRLENGLGDTASLVRARTALLDAEQRRLVSFHAERLAHVDLAVALGDSALGEMPR